MYTFLRKRVDASRQAMRRRIFLARRLQRRAALPQGETRQRVAVTNEPPVTLSSDGERVIGKLHQGEVTAAENHQLFLAIVPDEEMRTRLLDEPSPPGSAPVKMGEAEALTHTALASSAIERLRTRVVLAVHVLGGVSS